MVMSGIKTNLEGYFCPGKWYWWFGLGRAEKWLNLGKILEEEPKKSLDNRLDMDYAGKRGVKDDFWVWGPSSWVNDNAIIWMEKTGEDLTSVTTNTAPLPLPALVRERGVSNLPNIQRLYVRDHKHFRTYSCLYSE